MDALTTVSYTHLDVYKRQVLTNQAVAPFSAVTNNLAAGNYTLSAIASDNNGATATNSVNIVVDAPPIVTITNPVSGLSLIHI